MSKDDRIVVRMSSELRDWVHAEASAREMDDAAYVRMVLAEARSGIAASRIKAEAPLIVVPAQPIRRDMLDVSSAAAIVEPSEAVAEPQAEAPSINVDELVAASLAEAEAAGLTEAQFEDGQGEMPQSGVRPLLRRPVPFSRGTQHARLEQMFGGQ